MSTHKRPIPTPCNPLSITPVRRERLVLPEGKDFWVFGYGSLMWNPGFVYKDARVGWLRGYHRNFCVFSARYRGTPGCPGLVLGLDRGGSCRGMVFRVPAENGQAVMDYLYERELVTGVYIPRWLHVDTHGGRVRAAGFVVDRGHEQYTGKLDNDEMARLIVQGEGQRGLCREYLRSTVQHLDDMGVADRHLREILRLVDNQLGESAR